MVQTGLDRFIDYNIFHKVTDRHCTDILTIDYTGSLTGLDRHVLHRE